MNGILCTCNEEVKQSIWYHLRIPSHYYDIRSCGHRIECFMAFIRTSGCLELRFVSCVNLVAEASYKLNIQLGGECLSWKVIF
jgi:hypothetical protein